MMLQDDGKGNAATGAAVAKSQANQSQGTGFFDMRGALLLVTLGSVLGLLFLLYPNLGSTLGR
jgi:hypothetical protein